MKVRHWRGERELNSKNGRAAYVLTTFVNTEIKMQSHHRWSVHVHGLLMVRRRGVPVSKIVHIPARMHRCRFSGHGHLPELGQSRGARRQWRRGMQVLSLVSDGTVFHDFLVFWTLVLKPYFHLDIRRREVQTVNTWNKLNLTNHSIYHTKTRGQRCKMYLWY